MADKRKSSTPADRQILRLESLRVEKDKHGSKKSPKHPEPPRAAVERTLQRLERMRELAAQSGLAMPPVLPPVDLEVETPLAEGKPSEARPASQPTVEASSAPPSPVTLAEAVVIPPPPPRVEVEQVVTTEAAAPVTMSPPPPPPPCPLAEPVAIASAPPPPPPLPAPVEQAALDPVEAPEGDARTAQRGSFPKFDGRYKNVKLSVAQMKVLEQLFEVDPRLYPARVLRLALNQWLGMDNLAEDQALEPLSRDALIRIQKGL